jgi:7,8-dihydropterin-6-yl-methyl-4-(beta-D-ribofuranosyl)aminobenzene 5'-phosphate synthase
MEVKLRVLCENTVMSNLGAVAEHGWAAYFETDQGAWLFDTGQGKGLINNARFFRVDLSAVKAIMISHHHFDHTGGLLDAIIQAGPVDVFSHPDLFKEDAYITRMGQTRHIGIPFVRKMLENRGGRFLLDRNWREIAPKIFMTGEIPRKTPYETVEKVMQTKNEQGEFIHDQIMDDQAAVVDTSKGLFIILGCAHSGLINTINHIVEKTGQSHINAVIGGTHLMPAGQEQLDETIKALKQMDIDRIGVSHCTGMPPAMRLAREFGDKFFFCNVGTVVEV